MASLFPPRCWWALFLNTLPSTLFLSPPPPSLPTTPQKTSAGLAAIRVTLSPVSIPINQRWKWIPAGIIKGPAPVLLIMSNKVIQVIGRALGTPAGNKKSLHTLSVREPHSDVLSKHWADVPTKTFPSWLVMMRGFPWVVPNWRHIKYHYIVILLQ